MQLLRTLTYCWLILYPFYCCAQDLPGQTWYNYSAENGLPQNSAKSINIDKNGYVWIATEMGVVRFDGQHFRTYNRSNTPPLITDRIDYVDLQPNGEIYFTDESETFYSFNAAGQVIIYLSKRAVPRPRNGHFLFDSVWKHSENEQLRPLYNGFRGENFIFLPSGNEGTGFFLPRFPGYVAYLKDFKTRWVVHKPNFKGNQKSYCIVWHHQFYATIESADKLMTIDTLGKTSFVQVNGILPGKKPFALQNFKQVFEYKGNAYLESGKYLWKLTWQNPTSLLATRLLDVSKAENLNIYLHEPSMGLHLFGTPAHGLYIARQQQFRSYKNPKGPHNVYYAHAPFRDSGVITSTAIFLPHQPVRNTPPYFNTLVLLKARNGHYWTFGWSGLTEVDENLRLVQAIKIPYARVGSISESPDGKIWLTSNTIENDTSCLRLGYVTSDSITWLSPLRRLSANETFLPLTDSLFWFGSADGLQQFDRSTNQLKDFPLLQGAYVRRIYQDRKGFIWVGTYGSGFYVWNKQRFFKLPTDRNGYLNTAHAFLEDNKGFLWITTNKGLFQAKLEDLYDYTQDTTRSLYYHYYDKSDGLPSSEFNGGCTDPAVVLKNGTFSLSTMDGIVQFHPDSIKPLLPSNKIYIDDIIVDSSQFGDFANASLPASFNRLTITISSPYFGNPYNQQLEYNLAGLDDKWYPVNQDNKIIFNKLHHGNYQLQLRKKAGFGVDNYIMKRIPFTVQPGFIDTRPFKALILLVLALLVAAFVKFRTRYLTKRKNLLEQEVAARTLTQEQLISELHYNNRFKEKLALLITHDLQSPLRFLSILCDHLHETATGRNDTELRKGSMEIKNASQEIHAFVEEFGLWATTQQENFQINATRFSLASLLDELQRFFKEMITSQGNTLIIEVDPAIKLYTDRQLLKIVLRNLIDNANKYTQSGIIHILLKTENGLGSIIVRDNGSGIPLPVLQKLQARMVLPSKATILDKDSRLGYQVIIDFIDRIGARITLESSPEKGTSATISHIICTVPAMKPSPADRN